jgi:hypothetical protein
VLQQNMFNTQLGYCMYSSGIVSSDRGPCLLQQNKVLSTELGYCMRSSSIVFGKGLLFVQHKGKTCVFKQHRFIRLNLWEKSMNKALPVL